MKKKDIMIIGCKFLGIYLIVRNLWLFQSFVYSILAFFYNGMEFKDIWFFVVSVLLLLLFLGISYYFIKYADRVVQKIYPETDDEEIKINIDKETFQELVFFAIGVFLIATSLPTIPNILYSFSSYAQIHAHDPSYKICVGVAHFIIQLGIGTYLLLGSESLINLLKKMRNLRN